MISRRSTLFALGGAMAAASAFAWMRFPTDRTPKGAYFRVVIAVNRGDVAAVFPYLETAAQHAAFTIHGYVTRARARINAAYPEAERAAALSRLPAFDAVEAGPGVFVWYAERNGWIDRLRRDLSGVERVVEEGERATVQTARGTRYAFRRRDNGMWGLTLFTAQLVGDAEKYARDFSVIDAAARDYEVSRDAPGAAASSSPAK